MRVDIRYRGSLVRVSIKSLLAKYRVALYFLSLCLSWSVSRFEGWHVLPLPYLLHLRLQRFSCTWDLPRPGKSATRIHSSAWKRWRVDRLHKSQTLRQPPGRGGIPRDFYARYFYRFIHRDTPTPWSNEYLVVVELRIFVARERDEGLPGWSIGQSSWHGNFQEWTYRKRSGENGGKKGWTVSRTTRRFFSSTSKRNAGWLAVR